MKKSISEDLQPVSVHNSTERQLVISLPKSSDLEESNVVDLNQYLFNDDTICDQMFGKIIDSPPVHPRNEEIFTLSPDSPPLSRAPNPPTKPYYPPVKPLPQINTYSHSILDTGPCDEQSATPYSSTRMRVPSLCSPVHQNPVYGPCCVEHQTEYINRSSLEQRRYTYPGYEGTHSAHDVCSHTCTCGSNTAAYSACCSQTHFESGECPYSPVATRRGLSRPVSMPINDHSQLYCPRSSKSDQFNTSTPNSSLLLVPTSTKNTYIMTAPPSNLSHSLHSAPCPPLCVTCGFENNYVDSRECGSFVQIPSQREVSTQETSSDYLDDSLYPSQTTATQDSIHSTASSQQTPATQSQFDCLSREFPDLYSEPADPQRGSGSQKRKEQRKRNSERERKRLREINRALQDLGDVCCFHTHERANTKVETIEQAVAVITVMQTNLASISAEKNSKP